MDIDALRSLASSRVGNPYYGVDKTNYRTYLTSDNWKTKRELIFTLHGRRCDVCGSTVKLRCHHTTYERVGEELYSDLAVLCEECHLKHHNLDAISKALRDWCEAKVSSDLAALEFCEDVLEFEYKNSIKESAITSKVTTTVK